MSAAGNHISKLKTAVVIDEEYFNKFFDKYYQALSYYMIRRGYDFDRAQEVLMDAFTELWENREELIFNCESAIAKWMYAFLRTRSANSLRDQLTYQKYLDAYQQSLNRDDSVDFIPEYDAEEFEAELFSMLYQAIEELPVKYKEIVQLRLKQLTFEEIALKMRVKQSTVRSNLVRAHDLLRRKFKGNLAIMIVLTQLGLTEAPNHETHCDAVQAPSHLRDGNH